MAEPAVVDASPLIFLAGAGLCELTQLRAAGMYLSDSVLNRALKTVGE